MLSVLTNEGCKNVLGRYNYIINREENESSCWQFVVFGTAVVHNVFIAGITEKEWMEPIGMNE